jgi:hypothetical protein
LFTTPKSQKSLHLSVIKEFHSISSSLSIRVFIFSALSWLSLGSVGMDNRLGSILGMKDELGDSNYDRNSTLQVFIISHLFFLVIFQQKYNYILLWPPEPNQVNDFE